MTNERPGWGRPHTHQYEPTRTVGALTVERCSCGAVRHVVTVDRDGELRSEDQQ
jgi:hypothetical protein